MSFGCWTDEAFRIPPAQRFVLISSRRLAHSERETVMARSLDLISEVIRNPKHPFRAADNRPAKPAKHRYERRKIKEFIKLGDWQQRELA